MTGHVLPAFVEAFLNKGPKFALEPKPDPVDLVTVAHELSNKVTEDIKEKCVGDAMECAKAALEKLKGNRRQQNPKRTIEWLKSNKHKLLAADKSGEFVVMNQDDYDSRAEEAMRKNFKIIHDITEKKLSKEKGMTAKLCEEAGARVISSR